MDAILHDDLENAEYEIDCAELFKERMMTFLKKRVDSVPEHMIDDKSMLLGRMQDALDDAFYHHIQENELQAGLLRSAENRRHERAETVR